MGWPKGKLRGSGTGVGRKFGSHDKRSEGIAGFARSIIEDPIYQANFRERAHGGSLAPALETMLYHYAYGRPRDQQPDDQAFVEQLMTVVLKHAGSPQAQQEIREVLEAHASPARLSAVA
jgi:hypothetical protein